MSPSFRRAALAVIVALLLVPAVALAHKSPTTQPGGEKHRHRHHHHHKPGSTTRPSNGVHA